MKTIRYYDFIKRPLITEKTTALSEQNKYVFVVDEAASKPFVKEAIEAIFLVKVKKVNIINVKGKVKRFRGREGKQSDLKKAVVTLEDGHIIDFTGGVK